MRRRILTTFGVLGGAMLVPALASAHPGHYYPALGWLNGFVHPFTGIDHLLAMLAVGLWASQLGGKMRWKLPLTFVAMMVAGAASGWLGLALPGVEMGIATSVLVLGVAVALMVRPPAWVAMAAVGTFALFHGYAHAVEMTQGSSAILYAAGFVLATAILHVTGVGLGDVLRRRAPKSWMRVTGFATAAVGLVLVAGALVA